MARKVLYSFDCERDAVRVQQVKNMGVLAGQPVLTSNRWEEVTGGTQSGIKRWIDRQMEGKSCVVVLIGKRTAEREWVRYEIKKGWDDGRSVVGVFIHNLADMNRVQTAKGTNPFRTFSLGRHKVGMNTVVRTYDPPYIRNTSVYKWIEANIGAMVEEAVRIRRDFTA